MSTSKVEPRKENHERFVNRQKKTLGPEGVGKTGRTKRGREGGLKNPTRTRGQRTSEEIRAHYNIAKGSALNTGNSFCERERYQGRGEEGKTSTPAFHLTCPRGDSRRALNRI